VTDQHRQLRRVERLIEDPRLHYRWLLLAIVAYYFTIALLPNARWAVIPRTVAPALVLVLAYLTKTTRRRVQRIVFAIAVGAVAISILTFVFGDVSSDRTRAIAGLLGLLVVTTPVVILRDLWHHRTITSASIVGAVCVYLLLGLLFTSLYQIIGALDSPFFVQQTDPRQLDYLYFSFVTLTTVGYGDLTPAQSIGRSVVGFEALLGQVYLVTIVARMVSLVGQPMTGRRPAFDSESEAPPPPDAEGAPPEVG
jgi:hypothetical protein